MFKKFKFICISLALASSLTAFANNIHVQMDGVVCPSCIKKTKKAIKSIDDDHAVKSIDVDYEKLTFDLVTKDGKDLSDEEIKAAIKEKGYNVVSITRS